VWVLGHTLAVLAAKRDADFVAVLLRHLKQRGHYSC
jgi:type IV secretion system protein VirB3